MTITPFMNAESEALMRCAARLRGPLKAIGAPIRAKSEALAIYERMLQRGAERRRQQKGGIKCP